MQTMPEMLRQAQALAALAGLVLLWLLEGWMPFRAGERLRGERRLRGGGRPRHERRLRHAARNLALAWVNAAVTVLALAGATAFVTGWAERAGWGLLRILPAPSWLETALVLLLLDGWMYGWHRLNHAIPLLWRFHRVHHSDAALDVTTAFRFHVGEIALSGLLRLPVLLLIGASLWQVLLYEALLLPVIQLHHSNVAVPERWDRALRRVIVSPNMHRVHHSRWEPETNSNFSSVFSFWDRLAGTFRQRPDPHTLSFGLPEFDADERQTVAALLRAPFTPDSRASGKRTV